MKRFTTESLIHACVLAGSALCLVAGFALAQGSWEFLGPGVGYRPEAFFVSRNAVYVGLTDEDWINGYGLYRYRFDTQAWDLLAWDGYRILGIAVWGDSDENILLIRYGHRADSDVLRSTDGGATWVTTYHRATWEITGLTQAPSDPSRVFVHRPARYSTDGGWTWNVASGDFASPYDVSFDPSDPLVAYLSSDTSIEVDVICKSTNGGANWSWSWVDGISKSGIEVERGQTSHVMCATTGRVVEVTTDSGNTWSTRQTPPRTKMLHSPPWSPSSFFVVGSDPNETRFEVWQTQDLGETWFPCGDGLPDLPGTALWRTSMYLESQPTQPVLYAALEGSGIWRWQYTGAGTPDDEQEPLEARLLAYPVPSSDPFNYGVRLSERQHVLLRLFEANGRCVRTLQDGVFPAGIHIFEGSSSGAAQFHPASGIYYLRLESGGTHEERKIVFLK